MKRSTSQSSILTFKEADFIDAYVRNGGNATRAYLAACPNCRPKSAGELASRMLKKIKVLEAIELKRVELAKEIRFSRDEYVRILVAQARMNPGIIQDKIAEGVPLTMDEKVAMDCKPKDRLAALNTLADLLGFRDKTIQVDDDDLDDAMITAVDFIIAGRSNNSENPD